MFEDSRSAIQAANYAAQKRSEEIYQNNLAILAKKEAENRGQLGSTLAGTGLHSSPSQNVYQNYSRALGTTYNVDEYIPLYNTSYNLNTAEGKAQYAADRAEAENIRRYYEILSGYRSLLDSGQSSVASAYDKAATAGLQNLVNRGLSGTTILNNVQTQNAVNKANALQDNYAKNVANMLQFMERRNTSTGQLI